MQTHPNKGAPVARMCLVGCTNVGKSTLFNALVRRKQALVRDMPGVTRDFIFGCAHWWGCDFEVVDTGGFSSAQGALRVRGFEALALDFVVFVLDARKGVGVEEEELMRLVRARGVPYVLVVNKVDKPLKAEAQAAMLAPFYALGVDNILVGAFASDYGVADVVERALPHLQSKGGLKQGNLSGLDLPHACSKGANQNPLSGSAVHAELQAQCNPAARIRLCLVGKPNVGKSSLCNAFLGFDRCLVAPRAGTTTDSTSAAFYHPQAGEFEIIDTAGLRRAAQFKKAGDVLGLLASYKSWHAIKQADVVLVVCDVRQGVGDFEARMVQRLIEERKLFVLVANKCDASQHSLTERRKSFRGVLSFFPHMPCYFVSALKGTGLLKVLRGTRELQARACQRVPTGVLNRYFAKLTQGTPAGLWGTKSLKFYYITQSRQVPPSFMVFANYPRGVRATYRRFLTKSLQERWGWRDVPVRVGFFSR